jgi:hypothetical protein
MHEPLNEYQKGTVSGHDDAMSESNPILHQFEEITSVAAKAASDYQCWMLEQMKTNIGAAFNYANGIASVTSRRAFKPDSEGKSTHSPGADKNATEVVKIADEYRVKALELMAANIQSSLEYARRLTEVRTPAEFVKLSTCHAGKQLELIVKQATDLGSIAQRMTTPTHNVVAGLAKTVDQRRE